MRMWMINPTLLCDKHLIGEHGEIHKFCGSLRHGHNVDGYYKNGLIEHQSIRSRHDELAVEMTDRGFNHLSPLTPFPFEDLVRGQVNPQRSIDDLIERCDDCRERIRNAETERV